MNLVSCPHCKKQFEISEALTQQLKDELSFSFQKEYKEKIEKAKQEAEEGAIRKISADVEVKIKDSENQAKEAKERNQQLQKQLLELNIALRSMKTKDEERELEMQKKLRVEEEKIRQEAQKKAEEEQHTKILEKDKQLQDALKEVEEMKRKLQQGSQQLQGEVFEQELEALFKREFPNDQIKEVIKGMRGGDIVQEVWDRNGRFCGKVLWELKNTKTWSEQWIEKLKHDQRAITADYAVIVSEVVPSGLDSAKYYKNVWITKRLFVLGLACALRLNLIQVAMAKKASEGKKGKSEILYSYLSGTEFRLRIEALVEAFTNMQQEIEKEKRYFTNKWARDEKNIRQVIDNTYGMHGDLKGIMGSVLPQIKGLDTLELESGDKTS